MSKLQSNEYKHSQSELMKTVDVEAKARIPEMGLQANTHTSRRKSPPPRLASGASPPATTRSEQRSWDINEIQLKQDRD